MIIFLHGEDGFRSREKLAEIKNRFLEKNNPASAGLFDFAEKDWDIDEMMMLISSSGLFSLKKLAIIKNIFLSKKGILNEKFEKYLKSEAKNEKSNLILVFWESGKVKKSEKLYELLQKIAKCQEFGMLEGAKLKNWITAEIREIGRGGASISPEAVEKLVVFVGNDLNLLSKEIEKLVNFENRGEITGKDVEQLVKSRVDTDIFRTVDALARGDKKTALRLLHDHLETGDDPYYLLSMYFFQFRNLLKVKPLAEKNMPQSEIASKLKMHPFVARKSSEQSRRFELAELKNLYKKLCDIDFQTKTGREDIILALDKFIAAI